MYSLYEVSEMDSSQQPSSKRKVILSHQVEHATDMLQKPQANSDGIRSQKVGAIFHEISEDISDSILNPTLPMLSAEHGTVLELSFEANYLAWLPAITNM